MPLVSGIYLRALTGTKQRHMLVETWWIRWKLWWRGRGKVGGGLLISASITRVMTNFSGEITGDLGGD